MRATTPDAARRSAGAYGLRLPDLDHVAEMLPAAPPDWVEWRIHRIAGEAPVEEAIGDDSAAVSFGATGSIVVDRAAATATITSPARPSDAALLHPHLGAVAAVVNRWLGRPSFHGGGLLLDGGAWGVLGSEGSGKSTLLAALASRGAGVLGDDLTVAHDGASLAGPRCVDLRSDAADALALGEPIGVAGARERWRVPLPPAPATAPLRGWVTLLWGSAVAVRPVPPAERLPRLLANVTIVPGPPSPEDVLDLAALPMLALERPRDFAALPDACSALLTAVAAL
jgi:hypothetical protein